MKDVVAYSETLDKENSDSFYKLYFELVRKKLWDSNTFWKCLSKNLIDSIAFPKYKITKYES